MKVLSLFFIDEVSKYRLYDGDSGSGRSGEYAKMFEEEYVAVAEAFRREIDDPAYRAYLDGIDARETHQGYFSVDRRKGRQARFVEGKIDRKSRTSSDADAYDLIMRDKERLLSLDEPVRFLFSHSALREGWDNPNVFQICMLKPQTESEIRSRQEIGRGLRLCVNQEGERMDESVLGGAVQELNKLTLITDMEFGRFAEALQQGLAASLAGRPRMVEPGLFAGRLLTGTTGARVRVTRELADEILCRSPETGLCEGPRPHRQLLCGPGPGCRPAGRKPSGPQRRRGASPLRRLYPPGHPRGERPRRQRHRPGGPGEAADRGVPLPLGAGRPQVLLHRLL
ncbi:hypothetical protein [Dysosmobacter welbionis]|uniref:hypothetical protein n=1 Tax=Dysosmobacter welbionis TaxID=2093857 RepID=UPI00300EA031